MDTKETATKCDSVKRTKNEQWLRGEKKEYDDPQIRRE